MEQGGLGGDSEVLILAKLHTFDIRPEGWIHWIPNGTDFDVPRGPLGVMCYLVFIPLFWMVPKPWRATYLIITSLMMTVVTVGHPFAVTLAALAVGSYAIIITCANPRLYWPAVAVLVATYGALIAWPQPPWLPGVAEPIYFYLHWAGLAYFFLRTLHVLNDLTRGKIAPPRFGEYLAYLLFAPSVRMGPIQRYSNFLEQMHGNLAEHRQLGYAAYRICSGITRLVIMMVLMEKLPLEPLFERPWELPTHQFLLGLYLSPMFFYLWMSGYVDLSIGLARMMGFRLPENFNYPWSAVNIAEFWRRWHITLGAWLKDYVFTPLVRRRWHYFWAFVFTFTLCGLWHGGWYWTLSGVAQGVGLGVMRLWSQAWKQQKTRDTALYRTLARAGLVGTGFNSFLGWMLTLHYELLCIFIVMDVNYAGKRVGLHMLELLTGADIQ